MLFSRTVEERLNKWFSHELQKNKKHFDYSNHLIEIEEIEKTGKALVHFKLNGKQALFIKGEYANLQYIKQRATDGNEGNPPIADGIIFIFENQNEVNLHIIELKSTINIETWRHIKLQFGFALIRALALKGILEITLNEINFYTAYKIDQLQTILDSHTLKNKESAFKQKLSIEWKNASNEVTLNGANYPFKHTKIKLDKDGFGKVDLTI